MRFVHTSDLHLGRKLAQMSLREDSEHVFLQLEDLVRRSGAKALVVAGDVYDTSSPSESAARQWDRFLMRMVEAGVSVLVISGDHDSGARLAVGSGIIANAGVHIRGELAGELEPVVVAGVNFWLVPFVRPSAVRAWAAGLGIEMPEEVSYDEALHAVLDHVRRNPAFAERPNVCVAHQLVTNSGATTERSDSEHISLSAADNVDWRAFEGFDYVALGHVHKPQHVGSDAIRYAGSPLKLSTSEIGQQKSFAVVGIKGSGQQVAVKHRIVPVEPLRDFRLERGRLDELVERAGAEDERRRQDFVHAVITDDEPVDAVMSLRRVWPNLEQVSFDNAGTRAASATQASEEVDLTKGIGDLFGEFFETQTGKPLMAREARLVASTLDRVLSKGRGAL